MDNDFCPRCFARAGIRSRKFSPKGSHEKDPILMACHGAGMTEEQVIDEIQRDRERLQLMLVQALSSENTVIRDAPTAARAAKDVVQRRCCVCGTGDMVSVSDPPKCMPCVGNRPQVEIDLAVERWERRAEREAHNEELRVERAAKWDARKLWSASDANNAALVSILHEISDALGHERGAVPGTPFSRLPELVRAALAGGKAES